MNVGLMLHIVSDRFCKASNALRWVVLVWIAVMATPMVHADVVDRMDWYKDYEDGVELIDRGRYADAISKLERALRARGTDERNVRTYGMNFIDYLPNQKLGIAHLNLRNYAQAITHLERSLSAVSLSETRNLLAQARDAQQEVLARSRALASTPTSVARQVDQYLTTQTTASPPTLTPFEERYRQIQRLSSAN